RLVLREPDVTVDAEERAADGSRGGAEVGADLVEKRGEVADELERWLLDVMLVARLVGPEPLAVVVPAQVDEKREEVFREGRVLDHDRMVAETAAVVPASLSSG